jgi:hypothetical protein
MMWEFIRILKHRPTSRSVEAAVLAAALLTGAAGVVGAEPDPRPNILFCIADDASYPHMGAYGTS